MHRRVGIPRAMSYYYLYPFFRTLLRELGAEPVVSPPTSAETIERMEVCPTDEPCLPVKLHFSHADALLRRGEIDLLLLPVVSRHEGIPCCPKFVGVADMIRHGLRLPAHRVAMPVVDIEAEDRRLLDALQPLARQLGVTDRRMLRDAITRARQVQQQTRALCVTHQLTTPEAYRLLDRDLDSPSYPSTAPESPCVAVIGHPYVIHEIISQGMIERLREYGRVVTAEMVAPHRIAAQLATITDGARMWPFEGALLGAALHLLQTQTVDKMILVGSFECGPESIIEAFIEEEAERQGIPLMVLALDEHAGEAGLTTRLEAFMDTERLSTVPTTEVPVTHVAPRRELLVGFPSMGHLDTAIRTLLENCGTRTLPTPRTTAACVELGRELAPEFVCYPFVATLGQMRMLLDQGATALMMVGGKGYCRLGWYAQMQEALLRKLGYDFQLYLVESPFPLHVKGGAFAKLLRGLTDGTSWPRILDSLRTALLQLDALERADAVAHRLRAFERVQGTTDRITDRHLRRLAHARDRATILGLERDFREETASIELEETDPVRVGIVGEIWVVLEQAATRDVERWLGARSFPRVWVEREHTVGNWFRTHVVTDRAAMVRDRAILAAARPWLARQVGGHGQHTVGQVALARQEGLDGVLHVFPFTCMPEIIAQNIIIRMADELDIPVLTYIVSEQTGEAGMETRLESFLDLLEERRRARRPAAELEWPILAACGSKD